MTCPNCGKEYNYGITCPHCGVDTVLHAGTQRISDALYNKGLAKIHVSNLSGAMDCLARSVSINKNNTQARNLLGLVQYEIGHVGEALKNWVISLGLQKEDNPAQGYMDTIQKNARGLERLNDAIKIYNQALGDIWQKSDDMAIIKLRQAVDLNPKFIDAMNLLAFCYLIQKDKAKANAMIDRVLAVDAANTTAMSYYNQLNPPGTWSRSARRRPDRPPTPAEPTAAPYKKVVLYDRRNVNFHLEGILCLVIGVVCTLGIMFVLVNPAIARTQAAQVDDIQSRLMQMEQAHNGAIEEMEAEITVWEGRAQQSDQEAGRLRAELDDMGRSVQVLSAFELLRDGRLREAVDAIGGINIDGLTPDIVDRFFEIQDVAFPQLARQYYLEGVAAYNARDFEKSRVDFERAYRYSQHFPGETLHGDLLYYLAWTFSHDIDIDRAIHYFERFFEEFPGHRYTNPARNRFNAIS